MRFLILALGLLWPGVLLANDWDALERPGAFALMRHALAPGTGDPSGFVLDDCATQRTLDARGKAQARAIGAAFRDRGMRFDAVLSSQWCRCLETAALMDLGEVTPAPAFNSFFRDFDQRGPRTVAALDLLETRGGRPIVVTHQVNISALTGRGTRSGEVLVVRRNGDGLEVLGSILIAP
ncbi:Histidine phosphatase superfamily (branch 1) [Mameliella alba]|uniref:histidine phosphatase family protein n=1 Tax=Mameliella alba TaxID=561184 RepID=UPI000885CD9B|nr:histidine phosphatase family protein [Mameliella alba]OWV41865.1 histidine phosphatase family protein [Mameliella alba]PTR35575.1 histidine phosphatase superfamily protein (branch 1) [Mameliella alba]GGF83069.1 phosphoglycerate mutase [Mameliella alba]SDE19565.1 Histidine phosphatase superfamily (branch 1) [Mameliella alba]